MSLRTGSPLRPTIVLTYCTFLVATINSSGAIALPSIAREFGDASVIPTLVSVNVMATIIAGMLSGIVGDRWGHRRSLVTALALSVLGALMAGLSRGVDEILLGRILQGAGGGGATIAAIALAGDIGGKRLVRIQGILSAASGLAAIIGPIYGGFVIDGASWRWSFLAAAPFLAIAVASAFAALPRGNKTSEKVDVSGLVTLSILIVAGTMFLDALSDPNCAVARIVSFGSVAAAAGALFAVVERRTGNPVLPQVLFANEAYMLVNLVGLLLGGAMIIEINYLPVLIQSVWLIPPAPASLHMLPLLVSVFISSLLTAALGRHVANPRYPMFGGILLFAIGMLVLALCDVAAPVWWVWVAGVLIGFGQGPILTLAVTIGQSSVPKHLLGSATAGISMFRNVGGLIGIALSRWVFKGIFDGTSSAILDIDRALHPLFGIAAGTTLIAALVVVCFRPGTNPSPAAETAG